MKRFASTCRWPSRVCASLLTLSLWTSPSLACDNEFLFEPTYRAGPDDEYDDTIAGFHYRVWIFLDDRVLVTISVITEISTEDLTLSQQHPLFYIVTGKDHISMTYIDPEGYGHCTDIKRY